ncbi:MAG: hypothetical protein H7068_03140 [Pedobacter sp.]|nr:hypothetical protein [Chitinophagaceae bacterium]
MKKVMFLLLGTAITLTTMAQTTPTKKAAEKAMVTDVKDLKAERNERNTKIAHLKLKSAKHDQREINADRKHLHANKKHLKNKGVKTPVEDAKAKVNGN